MGTLVDSVNQFANVSISINLDTYGDPVVASNLKSVTIVESANLTLQYANIASSTPAAWSITGYYGEDIEYNPIIQTTNGNYPADTQTFNTFESANTATFKHVFNYDPELFTSKTVTHVFEVTRENPATLIETTADEDYDVIVFADINRHPFRVRQLVNSQTFVPLNFETPLISANLNINEIDDDKENVIITDNVIVVLTPGP